MSDEIAFDFIDHADFDRPRQMAESDFPDSGPLAHLDQADDGVGPKLDLEENCPQLLD